VNARTTGVGLLPRPAAGVEELDATDGAHAVVDRRQVWFDGGWVMSDVADRGELRPGNQLRGPVIVEQSDTTTVVPPGFRAAVDGGRNLIIELEAAGHEH
jgi:N-methylhydantoinase A